MSKYFLQHEFSFFSKKVELCFSIEEKAKFSPLIQQVHGNEVWKIECLEKQEKEETRKDLSHIPKADGLFTEQDSLPLYITTADCLPIFLIGFSQETKKPAIGALHCGWKGALAGIVRQGISYFDEKKPKIFIIGPSIGSCCFEVKEDFIELFLSEKKNISPYLRERNQEFFFDLLQFVIKEELKAATILDFWRCTYCSSPHLPSFRRNKNLQNIIKSQICFIV